ncbi:MAG: DUF937 domain-containing protein [Bacteroidetes bacterium]|nr:DUF937 domain-containing protein [Bacteroidota bacterium]
MGLLDSLFGKVLGGGKQQSNLVNELMGLLNNQQIGGISGLVEKLSAKGLGDVVNSWISTGKNMPVSPQQIQNALGSDTISQIAAKLGVNTDKASKQVSNMLPQIVDRLTPGGKMPEGDLMAKGMDLLKGLMK